MQVFSWGGRQSRGGGGGAGAGGETVALSGHISRVVIWANTYGSQLVSSFVNIIISPVSLRHFISSWLLINSSIMQLIISIIPKRSRAWDNAHVKSSAWFYSGLIFELQLLLLKSCLKCKWSAWLVLVAGLGRGLGTASAIMSSSRGHSSSQVGAEPLIRPWNAFEDRIPAAHQSTCICGSTCS